jgi:hypothetical protein
MRVVGGLLGLVVAGFLFVSSAAAIPEGATSKLPKLHGPDATDFARKGLVREFPFAADPASRDLDCNKRLNRVRFRCHASFFAGDGTFEGTIQVRYILKAQNRLGYRYTLRVIHTDTYCLDVLDKPREQCQDTITGSGNGYA